ncbi:cysteine--tRNA ligase [Helicobacter sp. MIT 99-5507]|uniref:cysteine--tRNA ligase n=1 Tax=Helicobacter sp. MIT 99-5507 TaxID=152489 RepID=UPI000E1E517E|nr:cysteine--tRNA ligase [Helicobacter sp. MIT 99-5507]RDU58564.1 cysteine--tRNA ligase [Helicobacter sp. MIT 99-5507]
MVLNNIKFYDSVKRKKLEFIPIKPNIVKIYLCGPTVYDNSHLGHARSAITFDLLYRVLLQNNYEVIFARNFTDIDDKIVKKSKEENIGINEITSTYITSYLNDMNALNILKPMLEPRATQNLDAIFDMIKILLKDGKAYITPNNDIYMRVSKDSKYGELSNRTNLESQVSRIGENEQKEDIRDFALWKIFNKDDDIAYDSPFGRGRPGWHIECSAMIEKHLAYKDTEFSIDIHAGGADLFFPHHENEASQSRCANNRELAKYWIHNGFVTINGEKMSKSLGNSFFVKDALKIYDGEVLRYYLLSLHYRSPLNFSHEDVLSSKKRLDRLYRLKKRVIDVESNIIDKDFRDTFLNALNDDLNISIALSCLDTMISHYNELLDKNPKDTQNKQKALSNIIFINKILGIGEKNPIDYFHIGVSDEMKKYIEEKIKDRNEAKSKKDYTLSDSIRDELKSKNIHLMDTKDGVIWEYIAEI